MFNRLEAYTEAGKRAAKAVNENDEARAAHERRYFKNMLLCENPGEDRQLAQTAYETAYKRTRNVPKQFQRFR